MLGKRLVANLAPQAGILDILPEKCCFGQAQVPEGHIIHWRYDGLCIQDAQM
jgi:hypothetical protein